MPSRQSVGAATSVISVYAFGIFLVWFPLVILQVPQPSDLVANSWFYALWQTMATVIMPCSWAIFWLRLKPADLGLTRRSPARGLTPHWLPFARIVLIGRPENAASFTYALFPFRDREQLTE